MFFFCRRPGLEAYHVWQRPGFEDVKKCLAISPRDQKGKKLRQLLSRANRRGSQLQATRSSLSPSSRRNAGSMTGSPASTRAASTDLIVLTKVPCDTTSHSTGNTIGGPLQAVAMSLAGISGEPSPIHPLVLPLARLLTDCRISSAYAGLDARHDRLLLHERVQGCRPAHHAPLPCCHCRYLRRSGGWPMRVAGQVRSRVSARSGCASKVVLV